VRSSQAKRAPRCRRHGPTIPGCPASGFTYPSFPLLFGLLLSSLLPLPFSPKPYFSVAPLSLYQVLQYYTTTLLSLLSQRVPLSEFPLPRCPDHSPDFWTSYYFSLLSPFSLRPSYPHFFHPLGVACLLLQYLLQSCSRGREGTRSSSLGPVSGP
jgi:hypothetical protein